MSFLKNITYQLLSLAFCFSSCQGQEDAGGRVSSSQGSSHGVITNSCKSRRADDPSIRILFIGNSLTYSNDLPKLVEAVGESNGKSMHTEMLAYGNYALEDHWNDGDMQKLICEGNFDFVVIQQGPSSQADGREMLFDYGQRIKNICSSRGTELAFFMVWPARANYYTFEGVIKNYSDAARVSNSILCAVGLEFKGLGDKGDYRHYSTDNFHPSKEGSQMAAEIIYSTLFK